MQNEACILNLPTWFKFHTVIIFLLKHILMDGEEVLKGGVFRVDMNEWWCGALIIWLLIFLLLTTIRCFNVGCRMRIEIFIICITNRIRCSITYYISWHIYWNRLNEVDFMRFHFPKTLGMQNSKVFYGIITSRVTRVNGTSFTNIFNNLSYRRVLTNLIWYCLWICFWRTKINAP